MSFRDWSAQLVGIITSNLPIIPKSFLRFYFLKKSLLSFSYGKSISRCKFGFLSAMLLHYCCYIHYNKMRLWYCDKIVIQKASFWWRFREYRRHLLISRTLKENLLFKTKVVLFIKCKYLNNACDSVYSVSEITFARISTNSVV